MARVGRGGRRWRASPGARSGHGLIDLTYRTSSEPRRRERGGVVDTLEGVWCSTAVTGRVENPHHFTPVVRGKGYGMQHKLRGILAILMTVGLLVAVASLAIACGGEEDGSASGTASPAAGGAGGLDQAHAQANLDGLEAIPEWESNGEPFDAKAVMAGKSILSIPGTGSDPFYQEVNRGMPTPPRPWATSSRCGTIRARSRSISRASPTASRVACR